MIDTNFRTVFKLIHGRLSDIKWALVGSTNLQLQGMQVTPHDLDIVIQHKDLEKVSNLFSDYSASPVSQFPTKSGEPAWEVKAIINGVNVQFFGGDEIDIYVSKLLANKILKVKLDDIEIPCFNLQAESQAYVETNREEKAKLIQEFLKTKKII